jgi:hypothetical protein
MVGLQRVRNLYNMKNSKKSEYKEYLDQALSRGLQEELERKAQQYTKYGLEQQAKKVREFKKRVRQMVGSL